MNPYSSALCDFYGVFYLPPGAYTVEVSLNGATAGGTLEVREEIDD